MIFLSLLFSLAPAATPAPSLETLASAVSALAAAPLQEPAKGRVIVLGMDGMDASMTEEWMNQGLLPNFSRLRKEGSFAPLMPANPAQSPVSWATLNSGQNPGKTGIFDFIGITRGDEGVTPTFGFTVQGKLSAADAGLPFASSGQRNLLAGGGVAAGLLLWFLLRRRTGMVVAVVAGLAVMAGAGWYAWSWSGVYPQKEFTTWEKGSQVRDFWEELDDAGVSFRGQGTVVSYPVQELKHGQLLAGLGAPDATAGLNSSQIWTTAAKRVRERSEYVALPAYSEEDAPTPGTPSGFLHGTVRVYRMLETTPGVWESKLLGPFNQVRLEQLEKELQSVKDGIAAGKAALAPERTRINSLLGEGRTQLNTWVPMRVEWHPGAKEAIITLDGATQTVAIGSWSDYFALNFCWSPRFSTAAYVRLWVEEIDGALEMYANPLQIDPAEPIPGAKLSWPADFASDLKSRLGPYETLGWACQTHAVKDAELSDQAFLSDIEHILTWRQRLLVDALEDDSWKVLFHFFGEPDRVCHMLMRHMDLKHPQYDAKLADVEMPFFGKPTKMRDAGLATYQQMDKVVGEMLDKWLKPDDVLLIVSDHGFDSFRRQVDLNAWMVHEGFMSIDNVDRLGNVRTTKDMGAESRYLNWVDWDKSSAYSLAIGKIYLNLRGRERFGIVDPAAQDEILTKITARLYELRDPDTGEKVVSRVYRKEEIYSGTFLEAQKVPAGALNLPAYGGAAELTVDFMPGYRCAWSNTTGNLAMVDTKTELDEAIATAGAVVFDNRSPWSGDHCGVDMATVQGIFFCNRPTTLPTGATFYDATHLAPTVLNLAGVAVPKVYDAAPLILR
jgi:predicted AlkP superfamily phosphohydrolase/phosphomutase